MASRIANPVLTNKNKRRTNNKKELEEAKEEKEQKDGKKGKKGKKEKKKKNTNTLNDAGSAVAQIIVIQAPRLQTEPWQTAKDIEKARGSGWFIRMPWQRKEEPTRYLITCDHVMVDALPTAGGIRVRTILTGPRKIPARLVTSMPEIDASLLEILPFSDSSSSSSLSSNAKTQKPFAKNSGVFKSGIKTEKGAEKENENEKEKKEWPKFVTWPLGDDRFVTLSTPLRALGYPLGEHGLKVVETSLSGRENGLLQLDGALNHGLSGAPIVSLAPPPLSNPEKRQKEETPKRKKTKNDLKIIAWQTRGVEEANVISFARPITVLRVMIDALNKILAKNIVLKQQRTRVGHLVNTPSGLELDPEPVDPEHSTVDNIRDGGANNTIKKEKEEEWLRNAGGLKNGADAVYAALPRVFRRGTMGVLLDRTPLARLEAIGAITFDKNRDTKNGGRNVRNLGNEKNEKEERNGSKTGFCGEFSTTNSGCRWVKNEKESKNQSKKCCETGATVRWVSATSDMKKRDVRPGDLLCGLAAPLLAPDGRVKCVWLDIDNDGRVHPPWSFLSFDGDGPPSSSSWESKNKTRNFSKRLANAALFLDDDDLDLDYDEEDEEDEEEKKEEKEEKEKEQTEPLDVVLMLAAPDANLAARVWRAQQRRSDTIEIQMKPWSVNGWWNPRSPYEKAGYEVFGGIVVVPLTATFRRESGIPILSSRAYDRDRLEKPALVISRAYPGGALDVVRYNAEEEPLDGGDADDPTLSTSVGGDSAVGPLLHEGDVIRKVNGRMVHTLSEYRRALLSPLQ